MLVKEYNFCTTYVTKCNKNKYNQTGSATPSTRH